MITPPQLKMARAALDWSVRKLAEMAEVDPNTVSRFENGTDARGSTLIKLQRALEGGGVIFLDGNGEGPGVRLKKKP
jgi:transcriptional regulator with XRE-family HTH domain